MTVRPTSAAARDLTEAVRFYQRAGGVGVSGRFLDAYDRAVARVAADPGSLPLTSLALPDPPRRCPLGRPWPYDLIVSVKPAEAVVVAVWHHSRDPSTLLNRL